MNSYRDVFVYVEGPSDAEGLKVLFTRLEFRHSDRHLRSVMIENFLLWPREG